MTAGSPRQYRSIAVIPARGGSKRLPRKNIIDFRGKPIIAYTIEAARDCGLFERVVVSTEDKEIGKIAGGLGAEVAQRPARLAGDEIGVVEVCLDLLDREASAGRNYDVLCCLYATAPLRRAADIAKTVGLIEPGVCDFAMAVTRYNYPPHQALYLGGDGGLRPVWPELVSKREQDIGDTCVDNGSTYAVVTSAFREHRTFYGATLRGHFMSCWRSSDINEKDDLVMAEMLAGKLEL